MADLREKIAKKIFIQKHKEEYWDTLIPKIKEFWLVDADRILAFIKEALPELAKKAGYKSQEQVSLEQHQDYLDYDKGVAATEEKYKGYVKLEEAKKQELERILDKMKLRAGNEVYCYLTKKDWKALKSTKGGVKNVICKKNR